MSAVIAQPSQPVRKPSVPGARFLVAGVGFTLVLLIAGLFMPKWLTFLLTMAASHGLVSLGIVLLMRGGVVSFGQGLVFAAGAYAAALGFNKLGITDAVGLALLGSRRRSRRCCRATAAFSLRC
jgi:ABC-type branched-subunit amino acid transport system permease subunit